MRGEGESQRRTNDATEEGDTVSSEAAAAFYERLEKEPELTERLRELETPSQIENYVKEKLGYDFTKAEM